MKKFECAAVVPGCSWHTSSDTEADVVARAVDHMRQAHGETIVRETMVERIKAAITDEKGKAA
ncbi:MAG: small metal-binding protein [Rhizobiales bacterium]|nr:small metal-binding protein [Hyphomicrobiales bacterium]